MSRSSLALCIGASIMAISCLGTGAAEPSAEPPEGVVGPRCELPAGLSQAGRASLEANAARCAPYDQCLFSCGRSGCGSRAVGGCFHICDGIERAHDQPESHLLAAAHRFLQVERGEAECY